MPLLHLCNWAWNTYRSRDRIPSRERRGAAKDSVPGARLQKEAPLSSLTTTRKLSGNIGLQVKCIWAFFWWNVCWKYMLSWTIKKSPSLSSSQLWWWRGQEAGQNLPSWRAVFTLRVFRAHSSLLESTSYAMAQYTRVRASWDCHKFTVTQKSQKCICSLFLYYMGTNHAWAQPTISLF